MLAVNKCKNVKENDSRYLIIIVINIRLEMELFIMERKAIGQSFTRRLNYLFLFQ